MAGAALKLPPPLEEAAIVEGILDEFPHIATAWREQGESSSTAGFYQIDLALLRPHIERLSIAVKELDQRMRADYPASIFLRAEYKADQHRIADIFRRAQANAELLPPGSAQNETVNGSIEFEELRPVDLSGFKRTNFIAKGSSHIQNSTSCDDYNASLQSDRLHINVSLDGVSAADNSDLGAIIVGELTLLSAINTLEARSRGNLGNSEKAEVPELTLKDPSVISSIAAETRVALYDLAGKMKLPLEIFSEAMSTTCGIQIITPWEGAAWFTGDGNTIVGEKVYDTYSITGYDVVANNLTLESAATLGYRKAEQTALQKAINARMTGRSRVVPRVEHTLRRAPASVSYPLRAIAAGQKALATGEGDRTNLEHYSIRKNEYEALARELPQLMKLFELAKSENSPAYVTVRDANEMKRMNKQDKQICTQYDFIESQLSDDLRELLTRRYKDERKNANNVQQAKSATLREIGITFLELCSETPQLVFYDSTENMAQSGKLYGLGSDGLDYLSELNVDNRLVNFRDMMDDKLRVVYDLLTEQGAELPDVYQLPLAVLLQNPEAAGEILTAINEAHVYHFFVSEYGEQADEKVCAFLMGERSVIQQDLHDADIPLAKGLTADIIENELLPLGLRSKGKIRAWLQDKKRDLRTKGQSRREEEIYQKVTDQLLYIERTLDEWERVPPSLRRITTRLRLEADDDYQAVAPMIVSTLMKAAETGSAAELYAHLEQERDAFTDSNENRQATARAKFSEILDALEENLYFRFIREAREKLPKALARLEEAGIDMSEVSPDQLAPAHDDVNLIGEQYEGEVRYMVPAA